MDKDKMKILMNPHGKGLKFTIVALEYSIELLEKDGKDATFEKKLLKEAQRDLRGQQKAQLQ